MHACAAVLSTALPSSHASKPLACAISDLGSRHHRRPPDTLRCSCPNPAGCRRRKPRPGHDPIAAQIHHAALVQASPTGELITNAAQSASCLHGGVTVGVRQPAASELAIIESRFIAQNSTPQAPLERCDPAPPAERLHRSVLVATAPPTPLAGGVQPGGGARRLQVAVATSPPPTASKPIPP